MLTKRKSYLMLFFAGLLLTLLFISLSQSRPLLDEGIYLTVGWLNSIGKVPYLDFFFMKPLGIVFALSAWFSLFGASLLSARVLIIVISLATMVSIFLLAKKMFNQTVAVFSAFFFVFWLVPFSAYWAILDPFLALISVFSALFLYLFLTEEKTRHLFIFGFFLGLGLVFKQTMVVFAGGAGLFALAYWLKKGKDNLGKRIVISAAAFFIAPLLFLLYLFYFNAFEMFWQDVMHPISMFQQLTVITLDARVLIAVAAFSAVPIALLALFKNYLNAREKSKEIIFLSLFFALGFASTLPFWGCCIHLISALPFASILAGFVVARAFKERNLYFPTIAVGLLAVSVIAMVFFQGLYASETYSYSSISEVALFVSEKTSVNDKILVMPASTDATIMPASADLYFLSKRQPAIEKFYYFGAYSNELEQDVLSELQQNKPRIIIYLASEREDFWKGPEKIDAFIQENYALTSEIVLDPPLYRFFTHALIFEPRE